MSKLETTLAALENAKNVASKELLDSEYQNLHIKVTNTLNTLINSIVHLTGGKVSPESLQQGGNYFENMTHVMGEQILSKEIRQEELIVSDEELTRFKSKVEKLYTDFPAMNNDAIISTYKAEPSVIRGVAKKAGLSEEKYKETEINYPFLEEIRAAMAAKEEKENAVSAAKSSSKPNKK